MEFLKFFDEYEIKARILPGLFVLLPIIVFLLACFPTLRTIGTGIFCIMIIFIILILLARIGRDLGKNLEQELYNMWGGKPTTLMLRHNSQLLDKITRMRYHKSLQRSVYGLKFPEDENQEDIKSDEVYESAVYWLKENTRDKIKFPLVLQNNINYGFARNLLGLKRLGVLTSSITLTFNLGWLYYKYGMNINSYPISVIFTPVIIIVVIFVWLFYVNPKMVRSAADAYALSLLGACDYIFDNSVK